MKITDWIPITKKEIELRGWSKLDVILVSGDAYIDHPSFGTAVIGRTIENKGFKVGIIPQPNWKDDLRDFKKFGKPNLFFAVTAGNMDSMVNHYTANKRLRSNDAYSPDGKTGFRPDYATEVYTKILKKIYPDIPVIIGGIEASLRRVTHYDYWQNKLMPSILKSSGADMLIYGLGEKPIIEILNLLEKKIPFQTIKTVKQTAILIEKNQKIPKIKNLETIEINSHQKCLKDKKTFARNFKIIETESNSINAKRIIQQIGDKILIINPPYQKLSQKEIDDSFDLPYTRLPHPKYKKRGKIPSYEMVKFSVNIHRGCFGGCSFCTIAAHQGKFISSRSEKSIVKEVKKITQQPNFKGYLSDLGGPSANMYKMEGIKPDICNKCKKPSCIHPKICTNLNTNHKHIINIYRKVDRIKDIKKSFISSGIRYDLFLNQDKENKNHYKEYAQELIKRHVSGRLKVAPEHSSEAVLNIMRKPAFSYFEKFRKMFVDISQKNNLKQQIIPYFISSHPNSTTKDMEDLALKTKKMGFKLEQIQDFTPTPMTLATVIYYSGYHPYTMEKIYTATKAKDKLKQRNFFFWYKKNKKNYLFILHFFIPLLLV